MWRQGEEAAYYEDVWNEIQEEEYFASLCEEWISKVPTEDLIRFDYVPQCEEQFYGYSLTMINDRLRLVDQNTLWLLMEDARDCITQQGMMIRDDLYGPVKRFYTPYYIKKE
jgi:hypothetical protein